MFGYLESLRRAKEEIDAGILRKPYDLKIPSGDETAQPEQRGRTLYVYLAVSGTRLAMRKEIDRHYDKEDLPWEPPFLECIYSDQLELAEEERKNGEARGAIPLSPLLAEAIRLTTGKVPQIPDDLFQVKTLVVDSPNYYNSPYLGTHILWRGKYLLTDLDALPRLSSHFYYSPGDWTALARMKRLRSLTICNIYVEDFQVLSGLPSLKRLKLEGTNFSADSLNGEG